MILDLRFNGGGSLYEAIELAGLFIDFGPIGVVEKTGDAPVVIKDMNRGLVYDGPLVITVRRLKAFNGKTTLRDSIAAYFRMSGILLNKDYGKIVDLEEIAEQSYDAMEAYLLAKEKAETKLDTAASHATDQYEAFAKENDINLISNKSELHKKLEKAGKISMYTNKVYLLFFKSYKNEAYLMDALNRNDITAVEQSRNALAASATEDLKNSGPIGAFNGDASLKNALQQILNFHKSEANDIKAQGDFLIAKDNFEKLKKNMDATPASKRTKEVVDTFNKAAADFNKKVNSINALHQDLTSGAPPLRIGTIRMIPFSTSTHQNISDILSGGFFGTILDSGASQ